VPKRVSQLLVKLLRRRLSNDCHMPNTSEEKAIRRDIALHLIDCVLSRKVRLSGCTFLLETNSMVVGKRLMLMSWLISSFFWRHMARMVALSERLVKLADRCSCRRERVCLLSSVLGCVGGRWPARKVCCRDHTYLMPVTGEQLCHSEHGLLLKGIMRGHDDENGAPREGIGNCLPLGSIGEQIAGNKGQIVTLGASERC